MPTPTNPLDQPVTALPAIGKHRGAALAAAGINTIEDLLYHIPRRYLDRSMIVPMTELFRHLEQTVTCIGRVSGIALLGRTKKRLVVTIRDDFGSMDLVFFRGLNFWKDSFTHDEMIAVSGVVTQFGRRPNIVHPAIDRLHDEESLEFINTGGIVPVYPSGAELEKVGLNRAWGFRRLIRNALRQCLPAVDDLLDSGHGRSILARRQLLPLRTALEHVHRPPSREAMDAARRRLAFDELFRLSLRMAYRKMLAGDTEPGIQFKGDSPTARALVAALPFKLTGAQLRVLREIVEDMKKPRAMNRLLQGDVGSGKTVVALLAMLLAVDNGMQAALMAPTEILAEQHFRTITSLVNDLGIDIRLLVGQQAASTRAEISDSIAGGRTRIVIGTHALIEGGVEFPSLGLVVIDEQHRFGVLQRAALRRKGATPDVLVMTATPIPRTLTMTLYGDLDVSIIDELPANRRNTRTAIRFEEDRTQVWRFVRREIETGNQAYIVFPLVSESEKLDLRAATGEYEALASGEFNDLRLGLLHGKLPSKEKDAVMMKFKRRELDILVTTTVIEVGVDVPDATVMIVEHAERFGLAQLHQLRGRVGRSDKQAYCILLTDRKIFYGGAKTEGERLEHGVARRRLETMRDTLDGFRIAEVDFEIRGPGDLWGTEQSGFPRFRAADLSTDGEILREARDEAFGIVDRDPHLRLPEHEKLKELIGRTLKDDIDIASTA